LEQTDPVPRLSADFSAHDWENTQPNPSIFYWLCLVWERGEQLSGDSRNSQPETGFYSLAVFRDNCKLEAATLNSKGLSVGSA